MYLVTHHAMKFTKYMDCNTLRNLRYSFVMKYNK